MKKCHDPGLYVDAETNKYPDWLKLGQCVAGFGDPGVNRLVVIARNVPPAGRRFLSNFPDGSLPSC